MDGAILEDVTITNITMRDLVDVPFFLRLGSRMRGPEGTPVGELRRVLISNVVVSNCASRQATLITGIPGHYIEDVKLNNILVLHQGGGTKEDAAIQPPELENVYPEPNRFGPLPAHGFYIRHAKRIEIKDVEVRPMQPDMRPGFRPRGCERRRTDSRQAAANSRGSVRGAQECQRFQRHAEQAAGRIPKWKARNGKHSNFVTRRNRLPTCVILRDFSLEGSCGHRHGCRRTTHGNVARAATCGHGETEHSSGTQDQ